MKKILLSTAMLSSALMAMTTQVNTVVPTAKSNLKITIYNSNLAFINDKRTVHVPKGIQNIVYQGIPKNVIPESVIPTFQNLEVSLFSQNYVYNLVSLQSMLKYSIDKEVEFYQNNAIHLENPELFTGILMSNSPTMIKQNNSGKIITVANANQIIFKAVPEEMITKPSLVWKAQVGEKGELGINLKYLTRGISWKSDYVLNLSEKTFDINGWITIDNRSGVAYKDAKITCLAGEVNKVRPNKNRAVMQKSSMAMDEMAMDTIVKEESFSGYHIYKIPFKETIQNMQKKQIVFTEKEKVPFEQYGYSVNNYFDNYGEQKMVFQNIIEFTNDEKSNMGVPLPSGVVRMYKKDSKGETHFIGEDRFGNIPKNERVKLNIGKMFDVVGDKKITKFKATKYRRNVETTYEVRNQGEDAVTVKISENIPTYGRHISVKSSCASICSEEKMSAFRREFTIRLKAEETYKFTSEFDVERN